jgi:hypothetical protein
LITGKTDAATLLAVGNSQGKMCNGFNYLRF